MLAIIDYGVGNISAFLNIYKQLNIPVVRATDVRHLDNVTKLILPGVGNFDYAMEKFNLSGMRDRVDELVLNQNVSVIGICVGLQMMANSSEEGKEKGLCWIDSKVKRLNIKDFNLPLPHMGWNDIETKKNKLFLNLDAGSKFYFLHSYYFNCMENDTIATTNYGIKFTCAANKNNIYGVQFHPEKSHKYGIQLLKNFAELC